MFTHPNAAAFPYQSGEVEENGLTKRELFAAIVYAGYFANPATEGSNSTFAESAVEAADALIAALNAQP